MHWRLMIIICCGNDNTGVLTLDEKFRLRIGWDPMSLGVKNFKFEVATIFVFLRFHQKHMDCRCKNERQASQKHLAAQK